MNTSTFAITPEKLFDWQLQLMNQLSSQALQYIGLAITIVLALVAMLYFFTLRPFNKELERQAKDIKDARISIQETIEKELTQIKKEMEGLSSSLRGEALNILKEAEKKILTRAREENFVSVVKAREELMKRIVNVQMAQSSSGKDLRILKDAKKKLENSLEDIEIDLHDVRAFVLSAEGKMGAFLVPLRALEKVIGTRNEYQIPYVLDRLKKGLEGIELRIEDEARISEVLKKLPEKYTPTKEKILAVVKSAKK